MTQITAAELDYLEQWYGPDSTVIPLDSHNLGMLRRVLPALRASEAREAALRAENERLRVDLRSWRQATTEVSFGTHLDVLP